MRRLIKHGMFAKYDKFSISSAGNFPSFLFPHTDRNGEVFSWKTIPCFPPSSANKTNAKNDSAAQLFAFLCALLAFTLLSFCFFVLLCPRRIALGSARPQEPTGRLINGGCLQRHIINIYANNQKVHVHLIKWIIHSSTGLHSANRPRPGEECWRSSRLFCRSLGFSSLSVLWKDLHLSGCAAAAAEWILRLAQTNLAVTQPDDGAGLQRVCVAVVVCFAFSIINQADNYSLGCG